MGTPDRRPRDRVRGAREGVARYVHTPYKRGERTHVLVCILSQAECSVCV